MDRIGHNDFKLASYQAVVFTPELRDNSRRLIEIGLKKWRGFFDETPISIPFPEEVPKEIPNVIFLDSSGAWRFEVSVGRASIIWRRRPEMNDDVLLKTVVNDAATVINDYVNFAKTRIARLAVVVSRYVVHDDPGLYLAKHFCMKQWIKEPFNRPQNFELHAHKQYSLLNDLCVNSWVRNKTGRSHITQDEKRIVLVEQDINTLSEESEVNDFKAQEIVGFLDITAKEFDKILSLYYPKGG